LCVSFALLVPVLAGCEEPEPIGRIGSDPEVARPASDEPAEDRPSEGLAQAQPRRPAGPATPAAPTPPAGADATTGDQRAPDRFTVRMETTKGPLLIDVQRDWAPRGADRFYTLVREGYFTDIAFFRVIEGFMAQCGIHGDPAVSARWRDRRIADDPPRESNTRGMVSFAMAGPNSRTTQFFVNFVDNSRLDSMGFAPFGRVRDMSVIDRLYDGYGEGAPRGRGPDQARIQREGNAYLRAEFSDLDYIRSASIEGR
jgi:peptidyl-prolyl cis-trans isomerase A (cyclophilin A)